MSMHRSVGMERDEQGENYQKDLCVDEFFFTVAGYLGIMYFIYLVGLLVSIFFCCYAWYQRGR